MTVHPKWGGDAAALAEALGRAVKGEVRFDTGYRALYATDASNYRQVPIGVVLPMDAEDIIAAMAECRRFGAPVLARGGGTSLAGQCCNIAVVLDISKHMRAVMSLDPDRRLAHVEPGCVLDHLRDRAEEHHLTFGPDPSTHDHNTLGGMLGNNSCGVHSIMAGRTVDNVRRLEILTRDGQHLWVGPTPPDELAAIIAAGGRRGEIYERLKELADTYADDIRARYPDIPRRVSGYNLDQLLPENGFNVARALVGSEGTCVTILSAELELVPSPPCRVLLVIGYEDVYVAADHVTDILGHGPIGLEAFDTPLVEDLKKVGDFHEDMELLPKGGGWLLAEFGADTLDEARDMARSVQEAISDVQDVRLLDDRAQQQRIWEIREAALAATAVVPGSKRTWSGWEDSAVSPQRLGGYLRDFRALLTRYGYACALYGHFGDGCVHVRIDFDLSTAEGIAQYRKFATDAARLVVSYGGSLSGEHGDGQSRAELLPIMFGERLIGAMREFKAIWDPEGLMNPGKVVDPYRLDENLRLGAGFTLPKLDHAFQYPEPEPTFAGSMTRCVGVGKCRRTAGGVMCPSFMATGEEMHSTRGRAHLLFEMVKGETIQDGWRSHEVRDALDLCLACKGCRSDCPVHVDMATYKAEFLSHYYEGRLRPRSAYSMGLIHWWARLAAHMPGLANAALANGVTGGWLKALGGIAPERKMPPFARQTLRDWQAERIKGRAGKKGAVVLFPDTFTNHFHPEIGRAAVRVLEAAGYSVILPQATICCGRPLYAWGMLDLARRQLRRLMAVLAPHAEAGTPIIGLEPSCVAALRDELPALFPDDPRARAICNATWLFGEFLGRQDEAFSLPALGGEALLHVHCHQHTVLSSDGDRRLLDDMGVDCRAAPAGCCGMAGAFGFEREHYDVAQRVGERALLPEVRAAGEDSLIITNGFSCREQIRQNTARRAVHMAEVADMALNKGVKQ
jgi:FAD/FMN-containing dehydrogenase/Fe-S oxidoreductase